MSPHPVEPYHATSSASTSSAGAAQQDGGSASSAIGKTAHGSAMSPITSPPATPLPVQPVQHQQLHVAFAEDAIAHPSSSSMLRRRTISQTRYGRDRDLRDERYVCSFIIKCPRFGNHIYYCVLGVTHRT